MAKTKDARITIILECTSCSRGDKKYPGVFRYTTQKNRRNTPTRIELKKFCPYCYRHTIYKEIKK
uniref:Large ribosomal subunit protein bL33c n=3 Tax=Lycopodioideae TaxID=1965347 RepID=A0A3Q9R2P4_DENOS|nr:ribosomal protein L33 [Dendrolycopodium obscurum]YP_009559564.1 ribosomal protein L33 [Diphasiastrum digitatum]YP_009559652.1 ribosomal protein L33 [Lycopodium clavatum]YP_011003753.1 ribosomal protein L33 [Lycopodium japonicum]AZU95273.1 ribosomal protein L33 [Dendrolycopodium obscurum]AZU95361.1 ribosomal protein L33 [Diphasiastrum digitatum]AZU95704.1 ribosomal protein L33 [Lycopodium clavatum]WPS66324.1 ribosomal protein L33 [Lycopodium japonicum]